VSGVVVAEILMELDLDFCALTSNKIRLCDTGTKGPFTHVFELKGVVLLEEQAGKA